MSADERQHEDVAGLFRKFGGDASGYKEFAPIEGSDRTSGSWPLVNGGTRPVDAPPPEPVSLPLAAAPPTPAPPPAVVPVATILAPAPAPAPTPAPAAFFASPAAAVPSNSPPSRELDGLFARLAGATDPAGGSGQGLLSRWRKPT